MSNCMSLALEQRLLLVATNAGLDALAADAKLYTCFKCGKACEDWEGSVCETCTEFFCDDCLVTDQQAMAPECCLKCAHDAAAMEETHRTLRRPD